MPQVFQVLRCYKCLVFQVQQTKKSIKWECKMCGEKQSLKRHYGIGTAKDCRIHVQKLNCLRGEINELKCGQMLHNQESDDDSEIVFEPVTASVSPPKITKNSKWSNYVEESEPLEEPNNEPMTLGDAEVVLEIPKKRRKPFQNYSRTTTYTKSNTTFDQNKAVKSNNSNENNEDLCYNDTAKSKTIIKSIPSVESYQPDVLAENVMPKENHKPKNTTHKKFVPPVINKNSKWAQFAEDETIEEPDITPSSLSASQSDNLFSLCDENDLDNILDF